MRAARSKQIARFVEVNTGEVAIAGRDIEIELDAGHCTVRLGVGWPRGRHPDCRHRGDARGRAQILMFPESVRI